MVFLCIILLDAGGAIHGRASGFFSWMDESRLGKIPSNEGTSRDFQSYARDPLFMEQFSGACDHPARK
jgi:hypothetical protein